MYWFKDGQPLSASAHIRMADKKTVHTLEVLSVAREDAGQYAAYISNTLGAAYSSARLLVRGGCLVFCPHLVVRSWPIVGRSWDRILAPPSGSKEADNRQ